MLMLIMESSFFKCLRTVDFKITEFIFHINSIDLTLAEVFNELDNFKLNLAPGPDNLSIQFFINVFSCSFILYFFLKSLKSGIFPNMWITVYISPIFKKGDCSYISN